MSSSSGGGGSWSLRLGVSPGQAGLRQRQAESGPRRSSWTVKRRNRGLHPLLLPLLPLSP